MRQKSESLISIIQEKLWEHCKRIIRNRYPAVCYTCGKSQASGSILHTGHMIAKASLGAFLKYDLRLLRPQCSTCNVERGGLSKVFEERMRQREGDEYVNQIFADRKVEVRALEHYQKLLIEYQNL